MQKRASTRSHSTVPTTPPSASESDPSSAVGAYANEIRNIELYAAAKTKWHEKVAGRNRRIRYGLGIPAALLAAVAGSAAVADWSRLLTAVAAFAAAALSTTLGFIKPEEGRVRHAQLRADWELLEGSAIDMRNDAEQRGVEASRAALTELREQKHQLDRVDV